MAARLLRIKVQMLLPREEIPGEEESFDPRADLLFFRKLMLDGDPNAPTCKECHGTHGIEGKLQSSSPTFPTNVPKLCARCHREGQKAAVRYEGPQHGIIEAYTESIHGKGLLKLNGVYRGLDADTLDLFLDVYDRMQILAVSIQITHKRRNTAFKVKRHRAVVALVFERNRQAVREERHFAKALR